MRKTLGIITLLLGAAFGGLSLWSLHGYMTSGPPNDETVIVACEREALDNSQPAQKGLTVDQMVTGCVEDQWKAVGALGPIQIAAFLGFGLIGVFLTSIGMRIKRKRRKSEIRD